MGQRKKPVVLGLDVSSNRTGYAVLRDGRWSKAVSSYGIIKTPTDFSLSKRLVYFRNEIQQLIRRVKPTHIIIEDVFRGRNAATMKLLSRFNGVAIEISRRQLRKDPQTALAVEVRALLGCGRTKKEAFSFICTKYGLDWSFNKMNDITDALALALYGHKMLQKEK